MSDQTVDSGLDEFFSECKENLQSFTANLAQLEKEASVNPVLIDAMYRSMHTMKGSAQLFGFESLGWVGHAVETALEPIRRLKMVIPPALIDSLFNTVDLIELILKEISMNPKNSETRLVAETKSHVIGLLSQVVQLFGAEMSLIRDSGVVSHSPSDASSGSAVRVKEKAQSQARNSKQPIKQGLDLRVEKNTSFASPRISNPAQVKPSLNRTHVDVKPPSTSEPPKTELKEDLSPSLHEQNSTVRIQVALLDKLMNLVGEMVLVRNQLLQYSQRKDMDFEFLNLSQRIDLVTSELQSEVMKTRMQPLGTILGAYQRMMRDLARNLGKQIEMTVQGLDTELDKTLIEAIKDPLTHMIRNSCDHGIETAQERIALGKNPVGHIRISAFQDGGFIVIELSDDGRGLNHKRIAEKAIERKLISAEAVSKMSEHEVAQLIFTPGFSTADSVSAISGRGVGMDIVKINLEKLGGQVELKSEYLKGMTIRMRIPLTLAIVPALIVKVGGEQFAIPQFKLAELIRVTRDGHGPRLEYLQGKPVFRLRGNLLSILELCKFIQMQCVDLTSDTLNIVVLNSENGVFGLLVDEIKDSADIVVKPLPEFLKRLNLYSGATIMGDGSVSLILDITGLSKKANFLQKSKANPNLENLPMGAERLPNAEAQDYLFFRLGGREVYSVPLCLVYRLEEFKKEQVEQTASQRVVKYRDSLLPLLPLRDFIPVSRGEADHMTRDSVSVVVVQKQGKLYGFEVDEIRDILSVERHPEEPMKRTFGVLGNILVGDEIVTVVDVLEIIDSLLGQLPQVGMGERGRSVQMQPTPAGHVLFAEDTPSFFKQVKKILESHGFQVTHFSNGLEAWESLRSAPEGQYHIILSDIEMPKMNGYELAKKIRSDSRFTHIPLVALTTKFRESDIQKGMQSGFDQYLEKIKADQLVHTLGSLLKLGDENGHK
ncbi:MAG: chemotaxis protein CheW [Bdellovibrionia bacterium]